jgi:hypothetical protein
MPKISIILALLFLVGLSEAVIFAGDVEITGGLDVAGQISDLSGNVSPRMAIIEGDLADNATAISILQANLGDNDTRIGVIAVDLGLNATKADNALRWLALNKTAIDDAVIDIAANSSRIVEVIDDVGANATIVERHERSLVDNVSPSILALERDQPANATKADNALAWLALNNTRTIQLELNTPKLSVIAGGSAGNHTLTGIKTTDALSGVAYVKDGTYNLTAVSDLSSEFTILAADVIENAAHTDTTGGYLIISWVDKTA